MREHTSFSELSPHNERFVEVSPHNQRSAALQTFDSEMGGAGEACASTRRVQRCVDSFDTVYISFIPLHVCLVSNSLSAGHDEAEVACKDLICPIQGRNERPAVVHISSVKDHHICDLARLHHICDLAWLHHIRDLACLQSVRRLGDAAHLVRPL